jgi:hypothetical protein
MDCVSVIDKGTARQKNYMRAFSRRLQIFHGEYFVVDEPWKLALQAGEIKSGKKWIQAVGDQLVSYSPATRCFRYQLNDKRTVYFKRYVYSKKHWFEFWMRSGKAGVEVFAYQQLAQLGIPTLDPVAYGEYRRFGMLLATCIVTREVPNAVELRKFAVDTWYQMPEPQRSDVYREIAQKLVEQLRTAHAASFFHHDLKWRNILIQKNKSSYTPVWIDAPRADIKRLRRKRGIMVDLSGLARMAISVLSVYARMRFICQYLGQERKPGEAKRLFQQVADHLSRRPPKPVQLPDRI